MAAQADAARALLGAADACSLLAVAEALRRGADPNSADPGTGRSALQVAASRGALAVVDVLLLHGAAPAAGAPPPAAELAVAAGHPRVAARLAQPPPERERLAAALLGAADVAAVREALAAGGSVNCADAAGETPLHKAAAAQKLAIVGLLLDSGAHAEARDAQGRSALCIVSGLKGADAAAVRGRIHEHVQRTGKLLAAAAKDGKAPAARRLLAAGAAAGCRLHGASAQGKTPLHLAASFGRLELVHLLLAAGADPRVKDDKGRTTVDIARAHRAGSAIIGVLSQAVAAAAGSPPRPVGTLAPPPAAPPPTDAGAPPAAAGQAAPPAAPQPSAAAARPRVAPPPAPAEPPPPAVAELRAAAAAAAQQTAQELRGSLLEAAQELLAPAPARERGRLALARMLAVCDARVEALDAELGPAPKRRRLRAAREELARLASAAVVCWDRLRDASGEGGHAALPMGSGALARLGQAARQAAARGDARLGKQAAAGASGASSSGDESDDSVLGPLGGAACGSA
eukprot:TRINITY_DN30369_c0_g1_i1.p1 TRINITY_DN30369_c0_g1~~TRINITY_DN30369_c0_g1_i1.p1  ORF type:complete len:551 (+),score=151.99 TRINITY_DN30369_c0_g1_i1:104-1654(+)